MRQPVRQPLTFPDGARRDVTDRSGRSAHATPELWKVASRRDSVASCQSALNELVRRIIAAPPLNLFQAVEAGVPMRLVSLIARATATTVSEVAVVVGISPRVSNGRKWTGNLPELAAHRLVGLLRVMASVRRHLCESSDYYSPGDGRSDIWVMQWVQAKLPELGGCAPALLLCSLDGQRAVEELLERMRGGVCA